mgnify:CR=1 FL=1
MTPRPRMGIHRSRTSPPRQIPRGRWAVAGATDEGGGVVRVRRNSLHAGQVIVADGTPEMDERLKAVLTNDPGMGIFRHADAGYTDAINNANKWNIDIPMLKK